MTACNKDARVDDVLAMPAEARLDHLEIEYGVNIREDGDGGKAHLEERHGSDVPREYLEQRFDRNPDLPAATKFTSENERWETTHKWLEAFARDIHDIRHPRDGAVRAYTLELGKPIGQGMRADREWKDGITTRVTGIVKWDSIAQTWYLITAYPDAVADSADKTWGLLN